MRTPNNIDKPIPGRGNNEATDEIKLAVDMEKLEFDAMNDILDTLMEEFKKEAKPETSFLDLPPFGIGFLLCNLLRLVAGSNLVSNNQA